MLCSLSEVHREQRNQHWLVHYEGPPPAKINYITVGCSSNICWYSSWILTMLHSAHHLTFSRQLFSIMHKWKQIQLNQKISEDSGHLQFDIASMGRRFLTFQRSGLPSTSQTEDEDNKHILNARNRLPSDAISHPRWPESWKYYCENLKTCKICFVCTYIDIYVHI